MTAEKEASKAKKRLGQELAVKKGFVAIGLAETGGKFEIVVHLAAADCAAGEELPSEWEGFSVRGVVTGPAHKLEDTDIG